MCRKGGVVNKGRIILTSLSMVPATVVVAFLRGLYNIFPYDVHAARWFLTPLIGYTCRQFKGIFAKLSSK